MLPVYTWWQIPYYWAGIKSKLLIYSVLLIFKYINYLFYIYTVYDLVAGSKCLKTSYVLSKEKAIELFPMLRKDKLCGAIVYYDGQHNDARMNISLAITAARLGATIINHVRVVCLKE